MHLLSAVANCPEVAGLTDHPATFPYVWSTLGWNIHVYQVRVGHLRAAPFGTAVAYPRLEHPRLPGQGGAPTCGTVRHRGGLPAPGAPPEKAARRSGRRWGRRDGV